MRSISRGFLTMCALASPLSAAFVPPAEGPVPFRRDRLPVDVETMTALSRQVTVLAAAETGEAAADRRAVAQMAALALALDPANRQARELIAAAEKGEKPEAPGEKERERALNRAWQTFSWLEMPEAGADGNELADCLGDVLAVTDPRHPKAQERGSEKGAWKDWVAEKGAFEKKEAPVAPPEMTPDEEEEKTPAETLALTDLELPLPLWVQSVETGEEALVPVKVAFHAEPAGGKGRMEFMVAGDELTGRFARSFRTLEAAMKARHGSLPGGQTVTLGFGKSAYSIPRNGQALGGTAALLLEGAITGQVPAAMTLSQIGEGGKLELPPKFWKSLRALSGMPGGGRLVLPEQAAEFLPALLTMDDAAFFMKWEVLLAGSIDELCDLAAAAPEGPGGQAIQRFGEIRKVGEGKALGTFLAHPATQQRLKEVTDGMPKHASARMLALQGSGTRPRFLPRPVLAREIRTGLEPAAVLLAAEVTTPTLGGDLKRAHEASRAVLDSLTGYIDIRDRDLHKSAMEVADGLRTLERLLAKDDDYTMLPKQIAAVRTARLAYVDVLRVLTTAAGDEADYPLPKVPAER